MDDPKVRSAYILTKVAMLGVAALATWPLSRVFGVKAWYGLGAFAVMLAALTVAVLAADRGRPAEPAADEEASDDAGDEDPSLPVTLPVEDSLDLHPFAPRDVPSVVSDYLEAAHDRGLREVRLIHGRGIGVQRERVRSMLGRHPLVETFHDAEPSRGGWGATVAYLKAHDEPECDPTQHRDPRRPR